MMLPLPVRVFIGWRFNRQSLSQVKSELKEVLEAYTDITKNVTEDQLHQQVKVPKSAGVNESMQEWSIAMILEHNTKVNGLLIQTIDYLARGTKVETKRNLKEIRAYVMPEATLSKAQPKLKSSELIEIFNHSVQKFLQFLEQDLSNLNLKDTGTSPHMVFGPLTAHQWCCMFVFHLKVHLKQARQIQRKLS